MLISCPSCDTRFNVDPAAIGSDGRQVRCSQCRTVWFASLPDIAAADEDYSASGVMDMDDIDLGEDGDAG